jgi:hypothetical protein
MKKRVFRKRYEVTEEPKVEVKTEPKTEPKLKIKKA